MNDEWQPPGINPEQLAAFQKIWSETFTKMFQLGFTYTPESAPPDLLRQMRSGLFQALSQSWDQFLRSPEFLKGTKEWMDNAVTFRKQSNDFLSQVRQETQGVARDDVDTIARAVRQMETRLLDHLEQLTAQVEALQQQAGRKSPGKNSGPDRAAAKPRAKRAAKPRPGGGGKPRQKKAKG